MDENGRQFDEQNSIEYDLDPRAMAEKAAQEARAAEMARQQQELRDREQQLIDAYRRQQQEQVEQIRREQELRARRQAQEEQARQAALEKEKAEKKARKKKGLKIACILLIALLAVSGIGFAAGKLYADSRIKKEEKVTSEEPSRQEQREEESEAPETKPSKNRESKAPADPSVASAENRDPDSLNVSLTDVSDIVAAALPSVVCVETTTMVTSYYRQYESKSAGSGIIIGDDGNELWIVTNHHVIEDATSISVIFFNDQKVEAFLKGSSQENDLAVLGVNLDKLPEETLSAIKVIAIGESDSLKLGQGVIAIGNAMGWGQSVTTGVVSALNREVTFSDGTSMYLLQTSAAINPGNSGGALLNSSGQLVGINNAKYSDTDVEGVGFAIPISSVREIMEKLSLMEPRVPVAEEDYPYMGATFKDLTSSYMQAYGMPAGAFVYEVGEGTPAEKAGLLGYDIITALDGVPVSSYAAMVEELQYHSGGSVMELTVMRLEKGRYNELKLTITLGYKKDYSKN